VLVVPAQEIGFVGRQVLGVARPHQDLLGRGQGGLESGGDLAGESRADLQYALQGKPLVEAAGPDVFVPGGVDELGRDAKPVLDPLDGGFQDETHSQLGPDLPDALRGRPVPHHRRTGENPEPPDLGELRQDLLVDTVGQVGVVRVGTEVHEGENRHRRPFVGEGERHLRQGDLRAAVVGSPPEHGHRRPGGQEESRHHQQLRAAHPLPPLLTVIPRQDQGDEEPEESQHRERPAHQTGPLELVPHVSGDLQDGPGSGEIGQGPLDELSLPQARDERGLGGHEPGSGKGNRLDPHSPPPGSKMREEQSEAQGI
jgi:hypothetical protein